MLYVEYIMPSSVLFVCTGNICRSPLAEGILKQYAPDLRVDSAGTHGYHIGDAPDPRSIDIASQHDIDISQQKARKLNKDDFSDFDLIIALDQGHFAHMLHIAKPQHHDKINILLDYAQDTDHLDVPDPYYGSLDDFRIAYDLIDQGINGLIQTHHIST